MDERELERIAGQLGRQAGERLEVDTVAAAVVARLRAADEVEADAVVRPRPIMRWLASAAAVVLLVAGSVVTFRAGPPEADRTAPLATDLYDLSSAELTEVLDSLSSSAPVSAWFAAGLDDLDTEQLEALLALMEG